MSIRGNAEKTCRRQRGEIHQNPLGRLCAYGGRLDPDATRHPHQIAALSRALIQARIDPDEWRPETWRRWALIAHGMALAGHDNDAGLGAQLSRAGVAEPFVTKLLAAQGEAPNWHELGGLILHERPAETIRLHTAGRYFSAETKRPLG